MPSVSDLRPRRSIFDFCIHSAKWVPVLFLATVIVWSYYAYVIQLCFLTVQSTFEKTAYLIGYHFFLAIFLWAYWQTIFTPIATVPKKFQLPADRLEVVLSPGNENIARNVIETFARSLPVVNRTVNGTVRYCEKCTHVKPDRAHHCSVCRTCVLKMDHHCPWVNNCVSFTNYKFFILFLGYAFLYCLFIVLTSLKFIIIFWKHFKGHADGGAGIGKFHVLFVFFVAAMFATSLLSLFIYHCYLVSHNRTTLEAFRAPVFPTGPDKSGFSLGKYNNFQEVFGDQRLFWFIPVFTSLGDGCVWPSRAEHDVDDSLITNHRRLVQLV